MNFADPLLWIGLLQIIGVNIVLSGDNAVVIALAARGLPREQQKKAIFWGSGAAVVMRIVLTMVAVELLRLPYLRLVGAALLLWIAVQLLVPEDEDGDAHRSAGTSLAAAIKTILLADLVMSLDNVIAVAAAAKGNNFLLIAGLAVSIPLVVFASRLLLTLMERFPIIITLGAALLGWVAGDMAITDPVDKPWVDLHAAFLHWGAPLAGAVGVVVIGKWLAARKQAERVVAVPAEASGGVLRRVLLAVDGSETAARAVRHVIRLREDLRAPTELDVHLVNVQRALPGEVGRFVGGQTIEDYHAERGEQALAPARAALDAAGLRHQDHRRTGEPGATIAALARELGCDMIVMGTRGLGAGAGALLGSVAQATLEATPVPVLLIR